MNIWSLNKDSKIKRLLLRLEEHFGEGAFLLAEPQDTNQLSIRIEPPDRLLTIYLYCYGQNADHHGVHFEYPPADGSPVVQEEIYDEVTYQYLIEILSLHLY